MQVDRETVHAWAFVWLYRLTWVFLAALFACAFLCSSVWLAGFALFALAVFLWSNLVEPFLLTVKRFKVPLVEDPKDWLRVAFLSDLHAGGGKGKKFYARMAKRIMAERPDVILFGGDFVELHEQTLTELEPLRKIRAPGGIKFILGNHDLIDAPEDMRERIQKWGWENVTNKRVTVTVKNKSFSLVGFDDVRLLTSDLTALNDEKRHPSILLVHGPDDLEGIDTKQIDLILCGHTHGGQVRLPFIGAIVPLPMRAPRRYDRGLRDWHGTPIIISQGLGEALLRLRLFCPPQIVMLEVGV
jgi:predicted MPP superfamily phosphohydrolase